MRTCCAARKNTTTIEQQTNRLAGSTLKVFFPAFQCKIPNSSRSLKVHFKIRKVCKLNFIGFILQPLFTNVDINFRCHSVLVLKLLIFEISGYNIIYCYIASAETKSYWLIHGHVALDKCNVSPGKQVNYCCPLRPAPYI